MNQIPKEHCKKVLIIRPDALGDMVLTIPCINAIKSQLNCHITVLASNYNKVLIEDHPAVDEIIVDKYSVGGVRSWSDWNTYRKELKAHQFDAAIHFYSETRTSWLAYFAGIKYHLGDLAKLGLWPIFRKHGIFLKTFDQTKHVVEYNFQLLKPLGVTLDKKQPLDITVNKDIKESVKSSFLKNLDPKIPTIGLQIGVGFGNKAIEPEKYAYYINALRKEIPCQFAAVAHSDKEKAAATKIQSLVDEPIEIIKNTTLKDLMGIISHYQLFVGVDTGPFHMAAAIGIPQLAIFPTKKVKPTRWAPWRNRHLIVRESATCPHPCPHEGCPLTVCSDNITVNDMVKKSLALLKEGGVETPKDQFDYWFKQSMTVLILEDEKTAQTAAALADQLSKVGIRHHREPINIRNLYDRLIEKDITVIHNLTSKRKLYIGSVCRIVSLKLFNPPLIINESLESKSIESKSLDSQNDSDYIAFYKEKYEKKRV